MIQDLVNGVVNSVSAVIDTVADAVTCVVGAALSLVGLGGDNAASGQTGSGLFLNPSNSYADSFDADVTTLQMPPSSDNYMTDYYVNKRSQEGRGYNYTEDARNAPFITTEEFNNMFYQNGGSVNGVRRVAPVDTVSETSVYNADTNVARYLNSATSDFNVSETSDF